MGNTETMKLTRTEPVGWTGKTTRELRRIARQRKRDCAIVGVCAKGTKKELNTLDEADFVRDVANRASHHLSQSATNRGLMVRAGLSGSQFNPIVHRFIQLLLAPDVAFRGLHRDMPE